MKNLHYKILLFFLLVASTQSFAQMAIDKGTKFVNLGIGVGGYGYYTGGGGIGLNAGLDFGIAPNITVGALAGYRSYGSIAAINSTYRYSSFDIGARGSYHFNELLSLANDKIDLYAGLGISYFSFSYGGFADTYGTVYVPIHVGGRYLFSERLGAFAELNSSLATLKLGLTLKF
ncbi:hypothetical protein [Spirosoma sp. KUDC1026]|uniref:hypothetical protein n=1 Tax=Spirosoma sp. KUDC1026 TaxID=2745947 RepID=UPI00159B9864|nr:hypothetical protein [Spirosoma sp. KUDC1026]QKZ11818.1 hypothetical protein HU175_03900 [Spirosoma sp. KUDC1026]